MSFWEIVVGVFFANMLTVTFVWGMWNYRKLEAAGRASTAPRPVLIAVFMPLLFLAGGVGVVLGF